MILVDSSVWIDYFGGKSTRETNLLDGILGERTVLAGDIIIAEVLQGFRNDKDFNAAREAFSTFQTVDMLNAALAVQSGVNFRTLRKKGITGRKTIDCLIATYCIENGVTLLHSDRDFEPFAQYLGLKTA